MLYSRLSWCALFPRELSTKFLFFEIHHELNTIGILSLKLRSKSSSISDSVVIIKQQDNPHEREL